MPSWIPPCWSLHSTATMSGTTRASTFSRASTLGIHRLNRVEYGNAVRGLLTLDVVVSSLLPADDANYGFDSIADDLTVSPVLLERYLNAAWKIGGLAPDLSQDRAWPHPMAFSAPSPRLPASAARST